MTTATPNRQTQRILQRLEPGVREVLTPAVENGVKLKQAGKHIQVIWEGKQVTVLSRDKLLDGKGNYPFGFVNLLEKVGALPPDWRDPPKVRRARQKRGDKAARLLLVKVRLQEALREVDALGGKTRDPRAGRRTQWITEAAERGETRVDTLRTTVSYLLRTPPDELKLPDGQLKLMERILGIEEPQLEASLNGGPPVAETETEPETEPEPTVAQQAVAEQEAIARGELPEPPATALTNLLNAKEREIQELRAALEKAVADAAGPHPGWRHVITLTALADPNHAERAEIAAAELIEIMST